MSTTLTTTPAEFLACAEKYAHLPTIAAIMRAYAENPQYTGIEAFYRAGQIKQGETNVRKTRTAQARVEGDLRDRDEALDGRGVAVQDVPGNQDRNGAVLRKGSGRRARSRSEPGDLIPTNPDFWRELRDFNVAHEKPVEEQGKHSHYRRSVNWLMHPGNCDGDCGPRKIRWMCAQPEESHAGRAGRRLAEIYGVK